jgi:5-methylcytosine-specific restriction endonuclease McrA
MKQELRDKIFATTGYFCGMEGCSELAEHIHHIVPDTKINNKRWGLYIQSPMNLMAICSTCHLNKPLPPKPNQWKLDLYEEFLNELRER